LFLLIGAAMILYFIAMLATGILRPSMLRRSGANVAS
jgi:hypothetical protein